MKLLYITLSGILLIYLVLALCRIVPILIARNDMLSGIP